MLLGGLELFLIPLIIGAAAAAVALAIISIAAIMECVFKYWDEIDDEVMIVSPAVSSELEKIAEQKGSKQHKRFAYNKATKNAVLVESDSISDELSSNDVVTVSVS